MLDVGTSEVDAYLDAAPSPQRETLQVVRTRLRSILPTAQEQLKYAMPAFTLDGKGVASFGAFASHCGYFPMSSEVLARAGDAVARYEVSKGGLRFPVDAPLPVTVLRTLVKLRLAELAEVRKGRRIEYYPDGTHKAVGSMADGQLHGAWTWYRRDRSVLRTGRFDHGRPVGSWSTWDRDGTVVTTVDRGR